MDWEEVMSYVIAGVLGGGLFDRDRRMYKTRHRTAYRTDED